MTEKNRLKLIKPTTTPINTDSVTLSKVLKKLLFIFLHTLTLNWLERRSVCRTPSRDEFGTFQAIPRAIME